MITVFADKYLRNINLFLPKEVDLQLYDPAGGLPSGNNNIDALLIRTVHPINKETLNRLPDSIQFIGTASAGTDHVDKELLKERNIAFADAAGCNARSVAEYVATSLLIWADQQKVNIKEKRIGVIGAGHVGSQVIELLNNLDIETIAYDPPRAHREHGFESAALEDVLSADILTLHTPLTKQGAYKTYHWLDDKKLNTHSFDLIINTARGGVVDELALLEAHARNFIRDFIIDVWENEPVFNDLAAKNAFIKTPHIAGYSRQAKDRASQIVAKSLCSYFSFDMPETDIGNKEKKSVVPKAEPPNDSLTETLKTLHPMLEYQKEMQKLMGLIPEKKASKFNTLRAEFPLRNEFASMHIPRELFDKYPELYILGFNN